MTIHIFNPEHDIALASGLANFTAPHAGRQLRHDLGFLPAIWAQDGDVVLADDVEHAERAYRKLAFRVHSLLGDERLCARRPLFLPWSRPLPAVTADGIDPWGWNSALKATLLRRGAAPTLLPGDELLQAIRQLSHRRTAAALLPKLRVDGTVGEAFECTTEEQVEALRAQYGQLVMKAPWSSSGRGLRFVNAKQNLLNSTYLAGWFRNLLAAQGSVLVEPYYNKVKDFGMEFCSDGEGHVSYLGLSLFSTENGAYTGNILATEAVKTRMMADYLPVSLLDAVKDSICRELGQVFKGVYAGLFGIDMMVVAGGEGFLLHPCVEINLRRTMGHVANRLSPSDDDLRAVMRIEYTDNYYKLKINKL